MPSRISIPTAIHCQHQWLLLCLPVLEWVVRSHPTPPVDCCTCTISVCCAAMHRSVVWQNLFVCLVFCFLFLLLFVFLLLFFYFCFFDFVFFVFCFWCLFCLFCLSLLLLFAFCLCVCSACGKVTCATFHGNSGVLTRTPPMAATGWASFATPGEPEGTHDLATAPRLVSWTSLKSALAIASSIQSSEDPSMCNGG